MTAVVLCLLGATLITAGVALVYVPAALVVAGGCLVAVGLFADLGADS